MNEINNAVSSVFILFEATINQMIDKRVEAKRDERLQTMWEENQALKVRIDALEQSLSIRAVQIEGLGIDQRDDAKRIDALENDSYEFRTAVIKIIDNHTMGDEFLNPLVAALTDNDEFRAAVVKVIDKHTMGDEFLNPLIEALAASDKFNDEINEAAHKAASDAAEEVMDNHTSEYNHDDIHEMSDMDEDAVREIVQESMRDTVNDLLDGATVSIRV
jgi:hypothetical protein